MKIFYCKSWNAVTRSYNVNPAAVVVAPHKKRARELLAAELKTIGCELRADDEVLEVSITKSRAVIIQTGDY